MNCKNCGKEIDKKAAVCPHCGVAVKKKSAGKIVLIVLLVILGIGIIGAAMGGTDEPKKVNDPQASGSQSDPTTTESQAYTVGDTLEMKDVRVTLNSVTESHGQSFFEPTDGNVFVIVEYTIENNGTDDLAISSIMCFECYADDFSCALSLSAMTSSDKTQLDGSIAAGKKINGVVGYEVPEDYESLELHYTPTGFGKDFVFTYEKNPTRQEEQSTEPQSADLFEEYKFVLTNSGYAFEAVEMAADLVGAERGEKYIFDFGTVELYCFADGAETLTSGEIILDGFGAFPIEVSGNYGVIFSLEENEAAIRSLFFGLTE